MNTTLATPHCPTQESLSEFLLGKIPDDQIDWFQEHLALCQPCLETVNQMNVADTFGDLTRDALNAQSDKPSMADDQATEDLIKQLQRLPDTGNIHRLQLTRSQTLRIAHDRAAEVERLLGPPVESGDIGHLTHYRVVSLLGAGSTGVVYQAIDEKLRRHVALKILRPSLGDAARERFIAEARATATIDHPNVVTIYEVAEMDGLAFIVMQWLPGETLDERLTSEADSNLADSSSIAFHTPSAVDETRQIAIEIAAGLSAAHACGLIHRDIKPANIWLPTDQAPVKILDFGLVRITDENPQLTCTGIIAGTPCYMSPEQSRGEPLDGRSDLFSLGCVMYQSLTGRLPFRCDNALATLQAIQREQPLSPHQLDPTIPDDLSDLVMCLLSKDPRHRPPNATALVTALQTPRETWNFPVAEHHDAEASQRPKTASVHRRSSNNGIKRIAIATALVLLGLGGYLFQPQITRIVTDQGEIVIDSKVDDIKIEVMQNGQTVRVIDLATEQAIDIKSGKYELRPIGDQNSVVIDKQELTLKRGEQVIVTITNSVKPSVRSATVPIQLESYRLDSGDVLSVYIDHVLGDYKAPPPVIQAAPGSGLPPSIGFPIRVEGDGTIQLPDVNPVMARGKTCDELKNDLVRAYTVDLQDDGETILRKGGKWFVSLIQPRDFVPTDSPGATTEIAENRSTTKVVSDEALFDGRTYTQWMGILKTDRDFSILNSAAMGASNLANEDQQDEVLDAIMAILRRGDSLADTDESKKFGDFLDRYFSSLSDDLKKQLIFKELEQGTATSQKQMMSRLRRLLPLQREQTESKRAMNEIASGALTIWERSKNASLTPIVVELLVAIREFGFPLELSREQTRNLVEKYYLEKNARPYLMSRELLDVALLYPELPGLLESFKSHFSDISDETIFKSNRELFNISGSVLNSLSLLPSDLRKELLPTVVACLDSANLLGHPQYSGKIARYVESIDVAPVESLTKIKELLEKYKDPHYERFSKLFSRLYERSTNGEKEFSALSVDGNGDTSNLIDGGQMNAGTTEPETDPKVGVDPIYNGKTYAQWLEIIKTERDLSIVNPALQGLSTLANEDQQDEMIAAVMSVARLPTYFASDDERRQLDDFLRTFFGHLDAERSTRLIVDELKNGTQTGRVRIRQNLYRLLPRGVQGRNSSSPTIEPSDSTKNQIKMFTEAIGEFVENDGPVALEEGFSFLTSAGNIWQSPDYDLGIDFADFPAAIKVFQKYYDTFLKNNLTVSEPLYWCAMHLPVDEGVVQLVCNFFDNVEDLGAFQPIDAALKIASVLSQSQKREVLTHFIDLLIRMPLPGGFHAYQSDSLGGKFLNSIDHVDQSTLKKLVQVQSRGFNFDGATQELVKRSQEKLQESKNVDPEPAAEAIK